MAESKPRGLDCKFCDHICENNELNQDGDCWGYLTAEERLALGQLIIAENVRLIIPEHVQQEV